MKSLYALGSITPASLRSFQNSASNVIIVDITGV